MYSPGCCSCLTSAAAEFVSLHILMPISIGSLENSKTETKALVMENLTHLLF